MDERRCSATTPCAWSMYDWHCTLPEGHEGEHVAWSAQGGVTWPRSDPRPGATRETETT